MLAAGTFFVIYCLQLALFFFHILAAGTCSFTFWHSVGASLTRAGYKHVFSSDYSLQERFLSRAVVTACILQCRL
jgi:hypothetical protein